MTILSETPQWLAVDKPAGLVVEIDRHGYPSVEAEVLAYLRKQNKREPFVGIVHRLDRPVSGVLLLAKKKSALKILNEQFRLKQVKKVYWAVVDNKPPEIEGQLEGWIKKDEFGKKAIYTRQKQANAQACSLNYRLLAEAPGRFLLEIIPHTGKFHQIRVQLAAIGCPIIGDATYGSTVSYAPNAIALHAATLHFFNPQHPTSSIKHPTSNIQHPTSITAPLPRHSVWQFENIAKS